METNNMETNNNEFFSIYHRDTWLYILSFLTPEDLMTFSLVNKLLNKISSNDLLWGKFLNLDPKESNDSKTSLKSLFFKKRKIAAEITAKEIIYLLYPSLITHNIKTTSGPFTHVLQINWERFIKTFKEKKVSPLEVTKKIVAIMNYDKKTYPNGINQLGFEKNTIVHCLATVANQETIDLLSKEGANFEQENLNNESPRSLIKTYNPSIQLPEIVTEEFRIGPSF